MDLNFKRPKAPDIFLLCILIIIPITIWIMKPFLVHVRNNIEYCLYVSSHTPDYNDQTAVKENL